VTKAQAELYQDFNRKLIELLIALSTLKNHEKKKQIEKRIAAYQENMAQMLED
jgi:hypothetical protein